MSEQKMNIVFNINEFIKAYDRDDFMKKVFKEVLKENPEIFTQHIKEFIFAEVLKTECYADIKEKTIQAVNSDLTDEKNGRFNQSYGPFKQTINKLIEESVGGQKERIANLVKLSLDEKDIKEKIAQRIANQVEYRVMRSLGDVCEGCDRDYM